MAEAATSTTGSAAAGPAPASQRWLYGPAPDLILGCGLGYMAIFVVLVAGGADARSLIPLGLLPLISVFAGTPHYGATLLRVYEKRSERQAYAFFAVWATAEARRGRPGRVTPTPCARRSTHTPDAERRSVAHNGGTVRWCSSGFCAVLGGFALVPARVVL